ncbi:MAG: hypothetical protein Q4A82_06350 [Corynebacterium sp.]|nr:hypothetical protein [Corynebacterium sp.]
MRFGITEIVTTVLLPIFVLIAGLLLKRATSNTTKPAANESPAPTPTQAPAPAPAPAAPAFTYFNCNVRAEMVRGCELAQNNWIVYGEHLTFGLGADGSIQYRVGSRVVWSVSGTGQGRVLRFTEDGRVVILENGTEVFALFPERGPVDKINLGSEGYLFAYNNGARVWNDAFRIDILFPNQSLQANQMLMSPNGQFTTVYQSDGNLVTYHGNTPVWETGTLGKTGSDMHAIMQSDGNFVIYVNGAPVWDTGTTNAASENAVFWIGQDGVNHMTKGHTRFWSSVEGRLINLPPAPALAPAPNPGGSSSLSAKVDAFAAKYNGRWIGTGQCTELFQAYNKEIVGAHMKSWVVMVVPGIFGNVQPTPGGSTTTSLALTLQLKKAM